MAKKFSNTECSYEMKARREFSNKTGSLTGRWFINGIAAVCNGIGDLPNRYALELENIARRVYVVYSYATPIAWAHEDDELLTVPKVNYSLTTTQHQGHCISQHRGWTPYNGPGTTRAIDPIVIGAWYSNGTPENIVRKGKGKSPYGEGWQSRQARNY